MRTSIQFALVGGLAITAACTTNNTTTTTATPSANAIIPASGFIGRQLRVEISGDNTAWTSATTVDFGAGVTVGAITVASPTDLFADITIDPTAAPGMHDVKISDTASGDVTLTQAFELDSAIGVTLAGQLAQGGAGSITITNKDFASPFDTTTDPNTGAFTNLTLSAGTGVTLTVSAATEYSITASATFDIDATSGPVTVVSMSTGGTAITSIGDMLTVAPRTATAITAGTPTTGTIVKAGDTALYKVDGAATSLLDMLITSTDSNVTPFIVILPASGKYADSLGGHVVDNELLTAATSFYLVVNEVNGSGNFPFTINTHSVSLTGATSLAEVEGTTGNNDKLHAQVGTGTLINFSGTLTDENDVDFIAVTVAVGKTITVYTTAGDAGTTDTVINIYKPDGTTVFAGPSADGDYAEILNAPAATVAGTYYVAITPSPGGLFGYFPMNDPYNAIISIQ